MKSGVISLFFFRHENGQVFTLLLCCRFVDGFHAQHLIKNIVMTCSELISKPLE